MGRADSLRRYSGTSTSTHYSDSLVDELDKSAHNQSTTSTRKAPMERYGSERSNGSYDRDRNNPSPHSDLEKLVRRPSLPPKAPMGGGDSLDKSIHDLNRSTHGLQVIIPCPLPFPRPSLLPSFSPSPYSFFNHFTLTLPQFILIKPLTHPDSYSLPLLALVRISRITNLHSLSPLPFVHILISLFIPLMCCYYDSFHNIPATARISRIANLHSRYQRSSQRGGWF